MKLRIPVLLILLAMLLMGSVALAAEDPLRVEMDLSAKRFSGPAEVTVTIRVINTRDEAMPGPMALYNPDGKLIEDFGRPTLSAGQTLTWTGTWMVTEDQIRDGRVAYAVQYTTLDDDGLPFRKSYYFYVPIEDELARANVTITRRIIPTMAGQGQKVSVIYEVANVGTIDVTDVVIKESSTISKTNGKIDRVKAGEKATYTFTVTMAKKDLTSNANITYSAAGRNYTDSIGNATIKYGVVNLKATLQADKKGGNVGDTVKLTLTLKNSGKSDYQNVSVTDPSLGTVFSGLSVAAGKTVEQTREITITETTNFLFTVTGTDASGKTIETATDTVNVTAVDPAMAANLTVRAEADSSTVYILPDVVAFTVFVTNNGLAEVKDVAVSSNGVNLYSFASILPGETKSFVREVRVETAGNFRFDAVTADQLGESVTFQSNLVRISRTSPTATPSQVPIPTPALPDMEDLPTQDDLPPYMNTVERGISVAKYVFAGIGAACVLLIVAGLIGRQRNAAQSNAAQASIERDDVSDYSEPMSKADRTAFLNDQKKEAAEAERQAQREAALAELNAHEAAAKADDEAEEEAVEEAEEEVPAVEEPAAELPAEEAPVAETPAADTVTYQRRRRHADEE